MTVGVALFFIMVGLDKFTGGDWIRVFAKIGYGQWFRYFTGSLQIIGALLMLVRKTSWLGSVIIGCTMVGAIIAQVRVLEGVGAAVIPAGLLTIIIFAALFEHLDP